MTLESTPALVPCGGCGHEYDPRSHRLTDSFLMRLTSLRCPDCRNKEVLEREEDHALHREARLKYQREAWLESWVPPRFEEKSFDTFDVSAGNNREKLVRLKEYVEGFPIDSAPRGVKSLILVRDVNGVGKTHLALSLLKALVLRVETDYERCPYQFWPVTRIRSRMSAAKRFGSTETEAEAMRDLATIWLLVLDDVGKDRLEGGDQELYFDLINERYNNDLPVIVTSNVAFSPWYPEGPTLADAMGRAAASRLHEMAEGEVYLIEGHERR